MLQQTSAWFLALITLSTSFIGRNAAAVLLTGGSAIRIYYHAADGAIHEAAGNRIAVNHPVYTDRVVSHDIARINSPIAAVTWKDAQGVEQVSFQIIHAPSETFQQYPFVRSASISLTATTPYTSTVVHRTLRQPLWMAI